jgi:XTP/dITP diphosphohydrolase
MAAGSRITRHASRIGTWIIATRNDHKVAEIQAILGRDFQYRTLKDFPDAPHVVEDAPDFAGNATKKSVQLANWLSTHHASRITHHAAPSAPSAGVMQDASLWILADDSGLEVDALQGAPGVHSARFAALDGATNLTADSPSPTPGERGRCVQIATNSSDTANNAKLLHLLADVPLEQRTARFRCVIAITPVITSERSDSAVCYADEAELRTELFDGVCEGHIAFQPSGNGGFGYDPLFIPCGHDQSFAELGEDVKNGLSHRAKALSKLREWITRCDHDDH